MPRQFAVTASFGAETRLTGIGITHDNKIELVRDGHVVEASEAMVEVTYPRDKGPKVVTRAPLNVASLALTPNRALEKYDLLYAIDTNTRVIAGQQVSAGCLVLAKCTFGTGFVKFTAQPMNWLELRNVVGPPENIVWVEFMKRIMQNPQYTDQLRIGVIVDSDLSRLADYNGRIAAVWNGFFLPGTMDLVYASAERNTRDYVPNALMWIADKQSAHLLKEIAEDRDYLGTLLPATDGAPYSAYRYGWCEPPD